MISRATISNIEEMAFAEIHNLRLLSLANARLMTMPPLKPVESTLYKLSLTRNNISSVPRGYFFGFKKLSILCLSGNAFKEIPDITALKNSLTMIFFDFNKIHSIVGWLNETTYPQLTDIHLTNNVIITFNPEVLLFWPALLHLFLAGNCIVHLPISYMNITKKNCSDSNRTASRLTFYDNPIHCDKMMADLVTRRSQLSGYKVFGNCEAIVWNLQSTRCASPAYLCGRDLWTLGM